MIRSVGPLFRSVAVVALLSGLALATPALAETAKPPQTAEASKKAPEKTSPERVEERIKELHEKLKITEDQEQKWVTVAETMRENEKSMHALIMERHEKAEERSAIEDLESYQKIAAAHAETLGKFIPVFADLYQTMTDEQKKNADTVFNTFEGHRRRPGQKAIKTETKSK